MRRVISETKSPETGLLVNNGGFALTGNFPEHKTENETELEAEHPGFFHFQSCRASG